MAAKFDLTAVARSLLNIEINTIVRDNMTGEPMPPLPHALLDIARDYAIELSTLGVNLADWFAPDAGDPEKVTSHWTDAPASVSGQLTISVATFDRLRWAAKWAAASAATRSAPLPSAKRVLIERIINNADAIKAIFQRLDKRFEDQFLNKTRDDLAGVNVEPGSYAVSAADLSLLQKIWDLGVEEIVAQTVVHVTGDVTTRVQEAFRSPDSAPLFAIHRQSIDVSVACWKYLLDAVREIAGATVGALLGAAVKLPGWLAAIASDFAALHTHWSSVRGGWRAARRDAEELVKYRRLLVDTSAMTADGMVVVLRTRLRIIGDTQTDILRRWLATATPEAVERTSKAHFQAVAAALGGWNAARAMERVVICLAWVIGGGWSVSVLLRTPTADLFHVLWTNWHLLAGIAVPAVLHLGRQILRWRLRALFHRGLTASLSRA